MSSCTCDPIIRDGQHYVEFIGAWFGICAWGTRDIIGWILGLCNLGCWLIVHIPTVYGLFTMGLRRERILISEFMLVLWFLGDLLGAIGLLLTGSGGIMLVSQSYYLSVDTLLLIMVIVFGRFYTPLPPAISEDNMVELQHQQQDADEVKINALQFSTTNNNNTQQRYTIAPSHQSGQQRNIVPQHETIREEEDNEEDGYDMNNDNNNSNIKLTNNNITNLQIKASTPYMSSREAPQRVVTNNNNANKAYTPQFQPSMKIGNSNNSNHNNQQLFSPTEFSLGQPSNSKNNESNDDNYPLPPPAKLPMFILPFNNSNDNHINGDDVNVKQITKHDDNNNNIMAMIYTAVVICIALCSGLYLQQLGLAWVRSGDTTVITTTKMVMGILQEQQENNTSNLPLCTGGDISDVQFAISVVLAFLTFVIYAPSRIPQIIKIHREKATDGLTYLFVGLPLVANVCYLTSVFLPYSRYVSTDGYTSAAFWLGLAPYPGFTVCSFISGWIILLQMVYYNSPEYAAKRAALQQQQVEDGEDGNNVAIHIGPDSANYYTPQIDDVVQTEGYNQQQHNTQHFGDVISEKNSVISHVMTMLRDQTTLSRQQQRVQVPPGMILSPSNITMLHPSGSLLNVVSFQRSGQSHLSRHQYQMSSTKQ